MIRVPAICAAAILLAMPVFAEDAAPAAPPATGTEKPSIATDLTPESDKLLWCASAFYWLAGSAEDSGDAEEAEMYDRWSKRLLEVAGAALAQSGYEPDTIETMVASYDERTLLDLAGDQPPYDVATCPALLGDFR